MRRILIVLAAGVAAAIAIPPLWFALAPEPPPELPPPGRRVAVGPALSVNVVEHGRGAPVVLVHGLPGCAYDWRETSNALAERGLRAIAYGRVGYGYSDTRSSTPFTVRRNAIELLALLEALDLRDATVVGWSYGGATAIDAAGIDPSRIGRIALVGSAGPGIEDRRPPPLAQLLMSTPVLLWLSRVPPAGRAVQSGFSVDAFSNRPAPDWWLPTLSANFARPATLWSWRNEAAALAGKPVPEPSGIELPILVVHGSDDRLVPLEIGRELDRRAPDSELIIVPDGSHMLPITHAELLADALVRFRNRQAHDSERQVVHPDGAAS